MRSRPILFEGIHLRTSTVERRVSRFLLEDETGRILVDPQGAEFWDGSGNFMWGPMRSIYLQKRYSVDVFKRHTRMLLPGDPVYPVGTVEINQEAQENAADEERLMVKPSSSLAGSGFLRELMFGEGKQTTASDIHHVFFLTDLTELKAGEILTKGLRGVWVRMPLWVSLSLILTLMYRGYLTESGPVIERATGVIVR